MRSHDAAAGIVSCSGRYDCKSLAIPRNAVYNAAIEPPSRYRDDFRQLATGAKASAADEQPRVKSDDEQSRRRKFCPQTCAAGEAGSCDGLGRPLSLYSATDDTEIGVENIRMVEAGWVTEFSGQAVFNLLTDVAFGKQPDLDLMVHRQMGEVLPPFSRRQLRQAQALADVASPNAIGAGMVSADEAPDCLDQSAGQFRADQMAVLIAQPGEKGVSCFGSFLCIVMSADQTGGKRAVKAIDGAGKPWTYQPRRRVTLARRAVDDLSNRPVTANQLAEFLDGGTRQASVFRPLSAVEVSKRQRIGDVSLYTFESLTSDEVNPRWVEKPDIVAADVKGCTQVLPEVPELFLNDEERANWIKSSSQDGHVTMLCVERHGLFLNSAVFAEASSNMGYGHDVDAEEMRRRSIFEGGRAATAMSLLTFVRSMLSATNATSDAVRANRTGRGRQCQSWRVPDKGHAALLSRRPAASCQEAHQ